MAKVRCQGNKIKASLPCHLKKKKRKEKARFQISRCSNFLHVDHACNAMHRPSPLWPGLSEPCHRGKQSNGSRCPGSRKTHHKDEVHGRERARLHHVSEAVRLDPSVPRALTSPPRLSLLALAAGWRPGAGPVPVLLSSGPPRRGPLASANRAKPRPYPSRPPGHLAHRFFFFRCCCE